MAERPVAPIGTPSGDDSTTQPGGEAEAFPLGVPEADHQEQTLPAAPEEPDDPEAFAASDESIRVPEEVSEFDAYDQAVEVPYDDDDERA